MPWQGCGPEAYRSGLPHLAAAWNLDRAERMLSDGDLPSFSPASGPFQDGRSEEGFSGDWRKTAPAGEGGEWSVKRDEKKLKKIKKVLAFLRGIPYNNIR